MTRDTRTIQDQHSLIQHARNGAHEAFVELLTEHGYKEAIYMVIREFTSQNAPQKTHEALYRKLIKDTYLALREFHPGEGDFGDWLYQTAKASLIAERKRIIRAKKGDKEAFNELIEEYKHVILQVVREYAPRLQEYDEDTLFDVLVQDISWMIKGFRINDDAFESWCYAYITENCGFIYAKDQFKTGNQKAFDDIFSQYHEQLIPEMIHQEFPKMQEQDRNEVLQEVTVRAYEKISQFRKNVSSFKYWLRKTTQGLCLNVLNFQARGEEFQDLKGEQVHQNDSFQARDELTLTLNAIEILPNIYKETLHLRYMQGLQYKQIAKILDTPLGNVKRRLHEARNMLRQIRKLVDDCNISLEEIKERLRKRQEQDKKVKLPKILDELMKACEERKIEKKPDDVPLQGEDDEE